MRLDSIVFGIAGVCFGLIAGWALGSQQAQRSPAATRAEVEQQPAAAPASDPAPALIDETRVQSLRTVAERDAGNVEVRVELANVYYDAERYDLAIPWYEAALALSPGNADVSTDLGVSYYQTNQPDKALEQFDRSLRADPKHAKTLLNIGIVRAFGKQDLEGATRAWQQVIAVAPGTKEAEIAQRWLASLTSAHRGLGEAAPASGLGR